MSESTHPVDRISLRRLQAYGLFSCLLYGLIALLSRQFALNIPSNERPHLIVLAIFAALFVAYLTALREAIRCANEPRLLWTIGGYAIVFRLLLLGTTPIQEIDLYRYLWDGHVVAEGSSPYRYSPQQVLDAIEELRHDSTSPASRGHFRARAADDLQQLARSVETRPSLHSILQTIHFPELTSPYPPASQAVFAAAAITTPRGATTSSRLIIMKGWVVLFDVLTIVALVQLLRATSMPVGWCLAYAWCPLVLKEFANSGHLDAIAVCLTMSGFAVLVCRGRNSATVIILAGLLFGLAIGARLYPVVLLPILMASIANAARPRGCVMFAITVLVTAGICLWPMLLAGHSGQMPEPTAASGLKQFLTHWRMNDLLFAIVCENLDPSRADIREPWFAIVPDAVRMQLVSPIMDLWQLSAARAAFLVSRVLMLLVFAGLILRWTWQTARATKRPPDADCMRGAAMIDRQGLERCFLALAWFWLLSPTQNPWYWTWALALIPFARSRLWLSVSGLTLLYYLRFWLRAHWPASPGPLGSLQEGASLFDTVVVWFEFGPLLIALLFSGLFRRSRRQQ